MMSYQNVAFELNKGFQFGLKGFERIEGVIEGEDYGLVLFENQFRVDDFVKIQRVFEVSVYYIYRRVGVVYEGDQDEIERVFFFKIVFVFNG